MKKKTESLFEPEPIRSEPHGRRPQSRRPESIRPRFAKATPGEQAQDKLRRRILVADDDKDIVAVLTMMLEEVGYEVKSTANEKTAQKVRDYLPDLILLDIWMTGVDGRDICKYLKSQQHTKHIPIIVISANQDTEKIAREAGADDLITKPFDMNNLLAKVAQYI